MSKPNILLLLTDQQRYDSLGFNGNKIIHTPNLDQLAERGVKFTHAFTPSQICTPARASLFSGKYIHNHRAVWNVGQSPIGKNKVATSNKFLTEILADAGYHTATIGKWHLGPDDSRRGKYVITADYQDTNDESNNHYSNHLKSHGFPGWDTHFTKSVDSNSRYAGISGYPKEHFFSNYIADQAVDFLNRNTKKPFFLCVSDFYPHCPWIPPEPYHQLYSPELIQLSKNIHDKLLSKPSVQRSYHAHKSCAGLTAEDYKRYTSLYYGVISLIDEAYGKILKTITELGLDKNTMIIFTSDHGEMLGNHQLLTKGPYMYDEIVRIPLCIKFPGNNLKGTNHELVSLIDLVPTVFDTAGLEIPIDLDGKSLLPMLQEETSRWRECVFSQYWYKIKNGPGIISMARNKNWKYCHHITDFDELYDLNNDPEEMNNLCFDPKYKSTLNEMRSILFDWMADKTK